MRPLANISRPCTLTRAYGVGRSTAATSLIILGKNSYSVYEFGSLFMQKIVWVLRGLFILLLNQFYFLPLIFSNQPISVILEIDSSLDSFYNIHDSTYETIFDFQTENKNGHLYVRNFLVKFVCNPKWN